MLALPIFPLGTVLVPGGRLPLRIFEPRYVTLLRDLIDHPERDPEFGVVAIRRGREVGELPADLHGIGCVARVYRIDAVGDGTFQILTRGRQRFRLEGFDDSAGTPYLTGRVTILPESLGDQARLDGIVRRVREGLRAYLTLVPADDPAVPDEPEALSYRIADLMTLDTSDRQALLACPDTVTRLALGARLLRRELTLVAELRALPQAAWSAEPSPY